MLGIPKENIFMLKSGNVLELSDKEAKVVDNSAYRRDPGRRPWCR